MIEIVLKRWFFEGRNRVGDKLYRKVKNGVAKRGEGKS
jgi:hypothetical protein